MMLETVSLADIHHFYFSDDGVYGGVDFLILECTQRNGDGVVRWLVKYFAGFADLVKIFSVNLAHFYMDDGIIFEIQIVMLFFLAILQYRLW